MTGVTFVSYSWAIEGDEVSIDSARLLCISRHTVLLPPFPPALHLRPIRMPHVHTSFEYARVSQAQSRPPPLLCVNCIIFTPNTFRPHASRHGPPGSTGQIAHVHRKSPPGTVSQRTPLFYPSTPRSALSSARESSLFSKSHVYSHLAKRIVLHNSRITQKVRVGNYNCYDVIF